VEELADVLRGKYTVGLLLQDAEAAAGEIEKIRRVAENENCQQDLALFPLKAEMSIEQMALLFVEKHPAGTLSDKMMVQILAMYHTGLSENAQE